ncbi:FimB/Mfa2 family fimbrial subunit [uncultured Parabacteroides sp.]|uniref:FimB/Mfa2 family fimbrial subunit n=1 Tax=uncultured Parabacteroides sp. TaxID=512312 RepID=UPI0025DB5BA6|nr:FimB/Mfa2 family fimbrial subunit [uncultured Parabacteroides sp.]
MNSKSLIRYIVLLTFCAVASFMTSCIQEDMMECRLYVRFKYDYNMLFTDAFHTQVDKVELYVFDKDGKFLFRQTEEGDALATGNYLMEVKLPVGEYQFLAWAGAHDSYDIASTKGESGITEMKLKLKREQSRIIDKELEPLWYGGINHVDFTGNTDQTEVISLIKNTNKVRFVFQGYSQGKAADNTSGTWNLNMDDYDYEIIESNGYLAYDNSLLDDDVLSYRPYYKEQKNSSAAVVELNTMRLMEDRQTRFTVTEKATGKKVFDINLIDYLAMTAMEGYSRKVQEYLDREDEYKIVFFFADSPSSSDLWQALQIQINGWTWYIQNEGGM